MVSDNVFNLDLSGKLEDIYTSLGLSNPKMVGGDVSVHFIDVGQGDSILIKTKQHNILIDGGDIGEEDKLIRYLNKEDVDIIDIMIATHPHADHIAGLVEVLKVKHVNSIIMPELPEKLIPASNIYMEFLKEISSRDINVIKPRVGEEIIKSNAKFTVLAPNSKKEFSDINDYSVTVRMDVGNRSFLFTGDIEKDAEAELNNSGLDLNVDVLKSPHHGSDTSSTEEFIKNISPKYVVISVGEDNKYDLPSEEVENRYFKYNVVQYRTDYSGTVVFTTDGGELKVRKEKD